MGWGDRVADWFGLVFVVAIIYVIVRPRSKARAAVEAVGQLMIALVRRATDLASTSTT